MEWAHAIVLGWEIDLVKMKVRLQVSALGSGLSCLGYVWKGT